MLYATYYITFDAKIILDEILMNVIKCSYDLLRWEQKIGVDWVDG